MGAVGLLPKWFGRLVAALPDPLVVLIGVGLAVLALAIAWQLYERFASAG